jgi:hypothetical protein
MDDAQVLEIIEALVQEEHRLLDGGGDGGGLGAAEHERLRAVERALDSAWDLLRQRRAREEFGLDPDEASPRPPEVVEDYEQ